MGLVKTRRLMAMRKQTTYAKASSFALRATEDKPVVGQRAIHLRRDYGGLKAGMEPTVKKGVCALSPHLYKSGGRIAADGKRK